MDDQERPGLLPALRAGALMAQIEVHSAPRDGGNAIMLFHVNVDEPPEVVAGQIDPTAKPQAMGTYLLPIGGGSSALVILPDGVKRHGPLEMERTD